MTTQDAKLNHLKKAERRMSELVEELSRLNEQISVITAEIAQTQAEIIGIVNNETHPLYIAPSKNKPKPKKEDVEKIIKNIYNKGEILVCTKDEMKSMHLLTISHFLKSQTCVVTPLSNSVTNVLARNGVFDAYALSLCTKHQLMYLRGISKQRILELEEFLMHIGVTLAEGDVDDDKNPDIMYFPDLMKGVYSQYTDTVKYMRHSELYTMRDVASINIKEIGIPQGHMRDAWLKTKEIVFGTNGT